MQRAVDCNALFENRDVDAPRESDVAETIVTIEGINARPKVIVDNTTPFSEAVRAADFLWLILEILTFGVLGVELEFDNWKLKIEN